MDSVVLLGVNQNLTAGFLLIGLTVNRSQHLPFHFTLVIYKGVA